MKIKWLLTGFSLLLILLTSCGEVKKAQLPRYRFEIGKPVVYNLEAKLNMALDGGFFSYNGDVELKADIILTAVETNEYGYKILLDIQNPVINGGDGKIINLAFYAGLTYFKNYFGTFYITDKGRTTVLYNNRPVAGLNAYAQILFPDFTDSDKIWAGVSETTNFPAKLQTQEYTMVYQRNWKAKAQSVNDFLMEGQLKITGFTKEDYLKSVQPQPIGNLVILYSDRFNTIDGQLSEKNGTIDTSSQITLKQDFLSYILSIKGNGSLTMKLAKNTNQPLITNQVVITNQVFNTNQIVITNQVYDTNQEQTSNQVIENK